MNVFTFTANLGSDCTVSTTKSGKTICNFSAAVSSGFGEHKKTTWVSCTLFGARAEGKLPQHLVKGKKVAVSGELYSDVWTDKSGVEKTTLKLSVNSIDLIGDAAPQKPEATQAPQAEPEFDDSIPF
jgi:single-strand DNA-binding protein